MTRATVEVTARQSIESAQVEVVLALGWSFSDGEARKRVLWSGRARAGQSIRVVVDLKATGSKAPAQAARIRLLDTTGKQPREVSSSVISVISIRPAPTPER